MKSDRATQYFRITELTRTALPALVEQLESFVPGAEELEPRSYPGYPQVALPVARARRLCSLDGTLKTFTTARGYLLLPNVVSPPWTILPSRRIR
jgi:hypothetical protein